MAGEIFLAKRRDGLNQGDIIDLCPVGAIDALRVVRLKPEDKHPQWGATVRSYPYEGKYPRPPAPPLFKKNDDEPESVLIDVQLRKGVVISEDCVLEKVKNRAEQFALTNKAQRAPWHVAPIDPWPPDTDTVDLDGTRVPKGPLIEAGRFHALLALPEIRGDNGKILLEKSVVDLRYITPLTPFWMKDSRILASMTDFGRDMLAAKLYTFHTGYLVPEALVCPSCAKTHSLKEILEAQPDNAKKAASSDI